MDMVDKEKRSSIMSKIKGSNTSIEIFVQEKLKSLGIFNFEINYGKWHIDIAFVDCKIALFIDGCFWHRCPMHYALPKSNIDFWKNKMDGNLIREKNIEKDLIDNGWIVKRIWEHDIKQYDYVNLAEGIINKCSINIG